MKIKKLISFCLALTLVVNLVLAMPVFSGIFAAEEKEDPNVNKEIPLMLWYDEEAPYGEEDTYKGQPKNLDDGWERWSIPLGNGYFGANVFGRTDSERVQLSEKTLSNVYYTSQDTGGWNNFSETYIDFCHPFDKVTDYTRALDLKTAVSTVDYTYDGVKYSREYFTSYEDYCMVIKLTADTEGKLDFTLRPTIPYLQDFAYHQGNTANTAYYEVTKHGNVTSSVDENGAVINLSGHMGQFAIDFEAQYRVFTDGTVESGSWTHTYNTNVVADVEDKFNSGVRDADAQTLTVTNGTLEISGATEAYVVITLGTNYDQSKGAGNSSIYTTGTYDQKLFEAGVDAKAVNDARMDAAVAKSFGASDTLAEGYEALYATHVADHGALFDNASFVLETDEEDLNRTTDELLARYQANEGDGHYLEMLIFQYGRYLMIASSRENSLPSNLQGAWNRYNYSSWGSGMWHNINEQMNYWAAFSTGLDECFEAYVHMSEAYMAKAKSYAASILKAAPFNYTGSDTGIAVAIGVTPYIYGSADSGKNAGNLGLTTQMFWDYYLFTSDEDILRDTVYPILYEAAQFITKTVSYSDSEDAYLSVYSDSPEQKVDGKWYYTVGTTYAQSFAYLNNIHLLQAAEILGYEDDALLTEVRRQINKYDAILVGLSGQVKEFREEEYYGDLGEWEHRHTSHLLGLYPGELINAETDAWLDAAKVTLTERGDFARVGWARALAISLWARTGSAEEAHAVLGDLIKVNTATNLWNLINMNDRGFFQVDGSFGATAGITEMLLQSHNGYIEPLAALPEGWANGSFEGLVARGGYTVSADWRDGTATLVTLLAKESGECKISLPGISRATVKDSRGNKVSFTALDRDLISFNAAAGEKYSITDIPVIEKVSPATDLAVMQTSKNDFALSWKSSADAVSYNVYKAMGDAPSYTYVASTTDCNYVYTTSSDEENARATYRVTAVDSASSESDGALCYVNPAKVDISDVQATELTNGKLQVLIDAEAEANVYTLYEYDETDKVWAVVSESEYPVIIYAEYDSTKSYAVSVTTGYFPSALYEIAEVGEVGGYKAVYEEDTSINVFEGVTESDLEYYSDNASLTLYAAYPLIKAFDGDTKSSSSRWATRSVQNAAYSVTVTLKETQVIKTLQLYDFRNSGETASRSDKTKVEVYSNGAWTTVLEDIVLDRKTGTEYCELDLGFVEAEKVRMTFMNTQSTACATIYEVIGTGAKISYIPSDEEIENVEDPERNILEGVAEGDVEFSSADGLYIYSNYPLLNGFDGDLTTRWATNSEQNKEYSVTVTLSKIEKVKTLRLYDFRNTNETASRSNNTNVEVYLNGVWTTVLEGAVLNRTDGQKYCELDLGFAEAEKIRITFENTESATCATIFEMTATGAKAISANREALLTAVTNADSIETDGLDLVSRTKLESAYNHALAVLGSIDSTSKDIFDAEAKLTAVVNAIPEGHDLDLNVVEDLKDGSGYPTTENANITNVGGVCGKAEDDLAYKLNGDTAFNFNFTRAGSNYAKNFTLEFNILLEDGAKFYLSNKIITDYTDGELGTAVWGGPGLLIENGKASLQNATLAAVDGDEVKGAPTELCDLNDGEWHKIAIVVPITLGELTEYVYFVINGTVCIVKVNTSFYGLTYPQFRKESSDGAAIYLDNLVQRNGTDAVYYEHRDMPAVLVSADENALTVANGKIHLKSDMTVGELKALTSESIRVYSDRTYTNELSNDDYLTGGEMIVAYTMNGRSYERVFSYYTAMARPEYSFSANLTLHSDFIYNLYLPTDDRLVGIAIDGAALDMSAMEIETDGEVSSYVIRTKLTPKNAGRNVKLALTFRLDDGTEITTEKDLGLIHYVEALLATSPSDELTTLAFDILSYIKSAYEYTEAEADATEYARVIAKITEIISEDYDETALPVGSEAVFNPVGLNSAALKLGSTPAFIFYPETDESGELLYSPDSYVFYQNGVSALSHTTHTDENGKIYFKISTYAYAFDDTVEYIVKDTDIKGAYNLAAYYDFALTTSDSKLIKLVEKLTRYAESAEIYKNTK